MHRTAQFLGTIGVALCFATSAGATTYTLTIAAGQPPRALPSLAKVRDFFVPEINKRIKAAGLKDKIRWRQAYAGSLIKARRVLAATQDGIIDIGYVPLIFHPDKLPLELVSFVTPFATTNVSLVSKAMERVHAKVPQMFAEYKKFKQVFLGGQSVDSYQLYTVFPVKSLADLKGRKIGTAGAALLWLRGIGVTPVSSNMMEYYNSTKTGVYDGFIIMGSTNFGMKYTEAAPYLTKVNFGAQYVVALTMNESSLAKLPKPIQKIIRDVGREWGHVSDKVYQNAGSRALAMAGKFGGKVSEFPNAERVKWANALPNIAKEWAVRLDKKGLPATQVLNTYMQELRALGANPARNWDKD